MKKEQIIQDVMRIIGDEPKGELVKQYLEENLPSGEIRVCRGTGASQIRDFFAGGASYQDVLNWLCSQGADKKAVEQELKAFWAYWTEPNKSGTKVKWEMEKTFDVKRRLATWFRNSSKFNKSTKKKNVTRTY